MRPAHRILYLVGGATVLTIATLPFQRVYADESPVKHTAIKPKLPPGVFLDEDGKPCKVCNSWKSYAKTTKKKTPKPVGAPDGESARRGGSETAALAIPAALPAMAAQSEEDERSTRPSDCPPDVEELGRSTWTFLHTTAAYYPINPTPAQKAQMLALIEGLATFYPCSYCAMEFQERIKENPPDITGREGLSRWFCERHNEVNVRLGKEVFDCSKVEERWKVGWKDGRCD